MVKPVELDDSTQPVNVKSFDGPMIPLKKPNRGINRLDVQGRLQKDNNDKKVKRVGDIKSVFYSLKNFSSLLCYGFCSQFIPRRSNIFHSIHAAPYATRIKPLDKNFKMRSHPEGRDVMFHGYLP